MGDVDHVRWTSRPNLRRPVLLAAFEGWNDAGDAASAAVRFIAERWNARKFATLDPEEFFDFTTTRPVVRLPREDAPRELFWPETALWACNRPGSDSDAIVLTGIEPQLQWRTFCEQILGVARELGAELVITCGALISDVPHTRPVQIYGVSYDEASTARLAVEQSTYEGPTGIVGVLHDACKHEGLPSASLWAAVPSYVSQAPSPKASLALVEHVGKLLDTSIRTTELEIASATYEREVSALVANDDETQELVGELERRYDELVDMNGDSLIEEVEQFLRDRPDD